MRMTATDGNRGEASETNHVFRLPALTVFYQALSVSLSASVTLTTEMP